MANIYYGTSGTAADNPTKEVIVPSITTGQNAINVLNSGDLLIVLFTDGNTVDGPRIIINNNDINQGVAITNDASLPIKVQATEVSLANTWVAGEVKFFVYIESESDSYFEMIGGVKGDSNTFGNVKITDEPLENINDKKANNSFALSPYGAKSLLDQTDGLVLQYVNNTDTVTPLGTLAIYKGEQRLGEEITIYDREISIPEITHTNKLFNNGPKSDNTLNNAIGAGNPFLTRYIPGNISFYSTGELLGLQVVERNGNTISNPYLIFEVSDANNNTNIFSKGNITLNAASGCQIIMGATNQGGRVGNTKIQGTLHTVGKLTVNGGFEVTSAAGTFSSINNLNVQGTLQIKGRAVPIAKQQIYNSTETTSVRLFDADIKGMRDPRIICTAQDGSEGIRRVNVETVDHIATGYFTVYFMQPVSIVSINYMYYPPS